MTYASERQRAQVRAYQEALGALRDFRPGVFAGLRAEEAADDPDASYSAVYARALYRLRDSYRNKFDRLYAEKLADQRLSVS